MPLAFVSAITDINPAADGSSLDLGLQVCFIHNAVTGKKKVTFGATIDPTPASFYSNLVNAVINYASDTYGATFQPNQVVIPQFQRGS